jgi:hypothetical protein
MQDAVPAVRSFAGKQQLRAFPVELRAPADQFLNDGGPFLYQRPNSIRVAESGSGVERVLLMQRHLVVIAESHRNASLRILGRGLAKSVLGYDENAAGLGKFNGGAQSRDPCANNKVVAGKSLRLRGEFDSLMVSAGLRATTRLCPHSKS